MECSKVQDETCLIMKNDTGNKNKLVRSFSLFTGTMLVVGMLIGSGVFKKIVPMAQTGLSDWQILAAWAVAGIITIMGALTIAGLEQLLKSLVALTNIFAWRLGTSFLSYRDGQNLLLWVREVLLRWRFFSHRF